METVVFAVARLFASNVANLPTTFQSGMVRKTNSNSNAIAFATMCELLNSGVYTKDELQAKLGVTIGTVTRWMKLLEHRNLVYIESYRIAPAGAPAARWTWGFEMASAPKPKPMTMAMYSERYRAKKRGTFGLQGVSRK